MRLKGLYPRDGDAAESFDVGGGWGGASRLGASDAGLGGFGVFAGRAAV